VLDPDALDDVTGPELGDDGEVGLVGLAEDGVARVKAVLGAEAQVYRDVAKLAKAEDLKRLRDAMEGRLEQMLPVVTQLSGGSWEETEIETGFLV